jgi:LmbE family N-acetylglucosaminyl deacetylase
MTTIDPAAPRGRVLLVEDDFEAASFAIQVLAVRNGFEVVHTADPAAALRLASSELAARILGARLYLKDLEDTRISEGDPTIGIISRVIGEVRPTMINTHSIHDVHQDHRNTHRAAMVAAREVGRVYCFQSPSATVDFRPTRFVSIDSHLDAKIRAIDAFSSQKAVRAYLEPDLISATARLALDALRGRKVPAHVDFREIAMVRFLEECFIELGEVRRVAA